MKFLTKFFWPLIPVVLLFATYREANSSVRHYMALFGDRENSFDTYKDLQGVAMVLAMYFKTAQVVPTDLKEFLAVARPHKGSGDRGPHQDAWLTPYQVRDHGATFDVLSCGPDRNCATETDNLVEHIKKVAKPQGAKVPKIEIEELTIPE